MGGCGAGVEGAAFGCHFFLSGAVEVGMGVSGRETISAGAGGGTVTAATADGVAMVVGVASL